MLIGGPVDGSWKGVAGMAEGWGAWLGAWEDFRAKADEYRELDGQRVLVFLHGSARSTIFASAQRPTFAHRRLADSRSARLAALRGLPGRAKGYKVREHRAKCGGL